MIIKFVCLRECGIYHPTFGRDIFQDYATFPLSVWGSCSTVKFSEIEGLYLKAVKIIRISWIVTSYITFTGKISGIYL